MRSSCLLALLFAPTVLAAQTSSALYAPQHPSQACPVRMDAHRIGGLAAMETDTPALTEQQKKQLSDLRDRMLELQQQVGALEQQKSVLQSKLEQNPDAATAADLRRQLADLEQQLTTKKTEHTAARVMFDQVNAAATRLALSQAHSPSEGLNLNIASTSPQRILAVDILVHGFSGASQVMPATQVPNAVLPAPQPLHPGYGSPVTEPTQAFHLTPSDAGPFIHSSIWTKGMLGIRWIEVTRVEFANGSSWLPTTRDECRFTPSLYVPVNATATPR